MRWTIAESWAAATDVVALAYGVPVDGVRAPSRGRGPKPPLALRGPRKVAVWLVVQASAADYAAVGREIGLHKDTVATHVGEVGRLDVVEEIGATTQVLLHMTRLRLANSERREGGLVVAHPRAVLLSELRRLHSRTEALISALSDEESEAPTSSDTPQIECAAGRRTAKLARAA